MSMPRFFGYGSLVNVATHDYPHITDAQLSGWRRVWRHTGARDVAFLTVVPGDAVLLGITAAVPGADWAALDAREWAYSRVDASAQIAPAHGDTAVYAVPERAVAAPSVKHPILQSYLDVVVQGYFHRFGAEGVAHFFETTDGWDAPILNDRAAPLYPRAQVLSAQELAIVDRSLLAAKEQA